MNNEKTKKSRRGLLYSMNAFIILFFVIISIMVWVQMNKNTPQQDYCITKGFDYADRNEKEEGKISCCKKSEIIGGDLCVFMEEEQ